MAEPVRLVFLGGLGEIGRNCMAIEQGGGGARNILLIDCGLMFPGADMHGIDLVLPDFTYLRNNASPDRRPRRDARARGSRRRHPVPAARQRRDRHLLDRPLPIYGGADARPRPEPHRGSRAARPHRDGPVVDGQIVDDRPVPGRVRPRHPLGAARPRDHRAHVAGRRAPLRRLQARPHPGRRPPHRPRPARPARRDVGIRVLLGDSTNAEEPGYAPSETSVGGVLRSLFTEHRDRRIITASFASHLHRIQQIADAAIESGRKVATLGLSMKKNVRLGLELGVLTLPESSLIDIEDIDRYEPGEVCVISTGSQGEPMSALALLARGENKFVKLGDHDTVILSSHADPRQREQRQPRHRRPAARRCRGHPLGHRRRPRHRPRPGRRDQDATCRSCAPTGTCPSTASTAISSPTPGSAGDGRRPRPRAAVRGRRRARAHRRRPDRRRTCPGRLPVRRRHRRRRRPGVLRDRRVLAEEGVVVVVVTVDSQTGKVLTGPEIITRGWVYAPEAEDLLDEACDDGRRGGRAVAGRSGVRDVEALERDVRRAAGKFVTSGPGAGR